MCFGTYSVRFLWVIFDFFSVEILFFGVLNAGFSSIFIRKLFIVFLHLLNGDHVLEVRFHGRGGQGAVTAANLLSDAAFREDKDVQSFPFFGVERRGAPVTAFARLDDEPIRIKSQIYEPDVVVVLDNTLLDVVDVTEGLKDEGKVILNTENSPGEVDLNVDKLSTVDATGIALDILDKDISNTSILGAFSKVTGYVDINSVTEAIEDNFEEDLGKKNAKAAKKAFEEAQMNE